MLKIDFKPVLNEFSQNYNQTLWPYCAYFNLECSTSDNELDNFFDTVIMAFDLIFLPKLLRHYLIVVVDMIRILLVVSGH